MKKTEKIVRIIQYINSHPKFNLKDIAENFSVSIRTAQRYIIELEQLGVPLYVEYGSKGGYHVINNKRILPPLIFTEEEANAIFFACQLIESYQNLPFSEEIIEIKRKFLNSLPEPEQYKIERLEQILFFGTPKRQTKVPLLKSLYVAILNIKTLEIQYTSLNRVSIKKITPLGVYNLTGIWYCTVYDYELNKKIDLRVDRIISLIESKDKNLALPLINEFKIQKHMNEIFNTEGPLELEVLLTEKGYLLCESESFFYKKFITLNGKHKIKMRLESSNISWLAQYFIGIGTDAHVIKPQVLREEIAAQILKLKELYL